MISIILGFLEQGIFLGRNCEYSGRVFSQNWTISVVSFLYIFFSKVKVQNGTVVFRLLKFKKKCVYLIFLIIWSGNETLDAGSKTMYKEKKYENTPWAVSPKI